MRLSVESFLKLADGRMGTRRGAGPCSWWPRTPGHPQAAVMYIEIYITPKWGPFYQLPLSQGPGKGAVFRADVTGAFSVAERGAGLRRRWGQWEANTGSPLPVERRSVLPVVKRKHYKVPVYVLK